MPSRSWIGPPQVDSIQTRHCLGFCHPVAFARGASDEVWIPIFEEADGSAWHQNTFLRNYVAHKADADVWYKMGVRRKQW